MGSLDNDINQDFQDAIDVMQRHSDIFYYEAENKYYETLRCQESSVQLTASCYHCPSHSGPPGVMYDWRETSSWPHDVPETSPWPVVEAPALFPLFTERLRKGEERLSVGLPEIGYDTNHSLSPCTLQSKSSWFRKPFRRNGRKKLRLYEYLHEALHDAGMADSIQWTDRGSGTFHFISKNKEKLAECWGQRKGNRKAMTYQKMARALRNYSRTGEIVKVRRKLTYQFNPLILQRLEAMATASSGPSVQELLPPQQSHAEQGFYCPALPDWHGWYGQHPYQGECDPTAVLTSHDVLKTQVSSQ